MGKGLPRSLAHATPLRTAVMKKNFVLNAKALSIAGASGVGYGTVVLGDLPEGFVGVLGAFARLRFTSTDADIQATFDGDFSVGTTPTADATLSTTDANIIPSTSFGGAATSGVSPVVSGSSAAPAAPLDNSDGSLELNLNVIIDDANISGTADMTVTGVVTVLFAMLGDD